MVRLVIAIALLSWGAGAGGWAGFFFMGCVISVLGIIWPPRKLVERDEEVYDEITLARRGSEVDPTRPSDYKGMKEYRRERR